MGQGARRREQGVLPGDCDAELILSVGFGYFELMKKRFRFQDLTIWQDSIQIAHHLADIADELEKKKLFRYAEQLRGAALSVSNNIAEGSGSASSKDFANFLNIAKRSAFELANMAIFFSQRGYFPEGEADQVLEALDHECRKIESFRKTLQLS